MDNLRKNVLITGSSGLIGTSLTELLLSNGFNVSHLTSNRGKANSSKKIFYWSIDEGHIDSGAFSDVDYLVNLSGASIGGAIWTEKRKKLIYDSRIVGTRLLADEITRQKVTLKSYFGASAIGYYGSNDSEIPNLESDDGGGDFLANVCVDWEKEHMKFQSLSENVSVGRISNVISKYGGMADPYKLIAKFGLQMRLSKDSKRCAWVSLNSLTNMIFHLLTDPLAGTFNLCDGVLFWGDVQKSMYAGFGKQYLSLRIPSYMLKIAMGEMSALITSSSNVSNEKIREALNMNGLNDVQKAMI
ncbi:MAG TPA: hypothetical protein DCX54_06985 [Flavobacteriales bacterium]|nr:hypothetical protein [Flavobacteriales bacterium]